MAKARSSYPRNLLLIPCSISPASIGDADYAFITLKELFNTPNRPAWVPKPLVHVLPQRLHNGSLAAWVVSWQVSESEHSWNVAILNRGNLEIIGVRKDAAIPVENAFETVSRTLKETTDENAFRSVSALLENAAA